MRAQEIADVHDIAKRLRHFLVFDGAVGDARVNLEHTIMNPEACKLRAGQALGLGDLIFVMRKNKIVADQERKLARLRSALEPAAGTATNGAAADQLAAIIASSRAHFEQAMDDDFNTSGALAALFELVRAINTARDSGLSGVPFTTGQAALRDLAGVLGLRLATPQSQAQAAAPFIELLIELRAELRKAKQFALADLVRTRLTALDITLEDGPQGTRWKGK